MLNVNVSLETFYLLWSWANIIIHFTTKIHFCCVVFCLFVYQRGFFFQGIGWLVFLYVLSVILSYWAFILDFPQVLEEALCTALLLVKYSSSGLFWLKQRFSLGKIGLIQIQDWCGLRMRLISSILPVLLFVYELKGQMLSNQLQLQIFINCFEGTKSQLSFKVTKLMVSLTLCKLGADVKKIFCVSSVTASLFLVPISIWWSLNTA